MLRRREVRQEMSAEGAGRWCGGLGGEERVRDCVGLVMLDEVDVRGWQPFVHRAPTGDNDRQVERERFGHDDALGFSGIRGWKNKHVGLREELMFLRARDEADVANERGGDGHENIEVALGGGVGERPRDREPDGWATFEQGEASGFAHAVDGREQAFFAAAEADKDCVKFATRAARYWAGEARARVCDAVAYDGDSAWAEVLGISAKIFAEHDGEVGAAKEEARKKFLRRERPLVQPFAEAAGMPVQHEAAEKRAAEEHHHPIAIERTALPGSGNIIQRVAAVPKPLRDGAQCKRDHAKNLRATPPPDLGVIAREREVHVVQFESGCPGESVQHGLHHRTLAVKRRRSLREHENFH